MRTRGSHNAIVFARLDAANVAPAVARQAAFFKALREDLEWKLYAHDALQELPAALVRSGFEADDVETLMAVELATFSTGSRGADIEIRTLRAERDLELYGELSARAFGERAKSSTAGFERRLFGEGADTVALIAYFDGVPAAAGRLELPRERRFASLWGGRTLPAWRSRGIYRALVDERARIARERGYEFLTVDACDTSRPILERLGFAALTTVTGWQLSASAPRS